MTLQTWHNVRSESLDMRTTLSVITPEAPTNESLPGLLILLHGLTGNHAVWHMRSDLQTIADRHNLVLALPDGQRSFWIDQDFGLQWGQWVGSELPQILQRILRLAGTRAHTFIGGFSMGGYGAVRAAVDYPQNFAGAFSLSGTLDVAEAAFRGRHLDLYEQGFGDSKTPRPQDDLVQRMHDLGAARLDATPGAGSDAANLRSLRLFTCCGEDDRLLGQNLRFADAARSANLQLTWEVADGAHDFKFWNQWLPVAVNTMVDTA